MEFFYFILSTDPVRQLEEVFQFRGFKFIVLFHLAGPVRNDW